MFSLKGVITTDHSLQLSGQVARSSWGESMGMASGWNGMLAL